MNLCNVCMYAHWKFLYLCSSLSGESLYKRKLKKSKYILSGKKNCVTEFAVSVRYLIYDRYLLVIRTKINITLLISKLKYKK